MKKSHIVNVIHLKKKKQRPKNYNLKRDNILLLSPVCFVNQNIFVLIGTAALYCFHVKIADSLQNDWINLYSLWVFFFFLGTNAVLDTEGSWRTYAVYLLLLVA